MGDLPEDRYRAFFARWAQVIILFDLGVALLVHLLGLKVDPLCYGLVIATFVAALLVGMFFLSSKAGLRTDAELGLKGFEDKLDYNWGPVGYPARIYVYAGLALVVTLVVGGPSRAPGILAFSTLFLGAAYAAMMRQWPADRPERRRS
jgi:hypothetical protein